MTHDEILDDAIAFATEQWKRSDSSGSVPSNINLRDRVTLFASALRKGLLTEFPSLRSAGDQVLLLVVAEGIAKSGTVGRDKLEKALGIILPPEATNA